MSGVAEATLRSTKCSGGCDLNYFHLSSNITDKRVAVYFLTEPAT